MIFVTFHNENELPVYSNDRSCVCRELVKMNIENKIFI